MGSAGRASPSTHPSPDPSDRRIAGEMGVSFLDKLFGRRESSSTVARERLLTVLVHDRVKLTPELMDQLKAELSAVIARYVPSADATAIEVTLLHGESVDYLKADVPLRRGAAERLVIEE